MPSARPMSEAEFRGHVKKGAKTNFIFNVLINGVVGWLLFSGSESLTAFGDESYGPDLLITGFLLSAIVSAIGIWVHRGKAAKGELGAPPASEVGWIAPAANWNPWATAGFLGVVGVTVSGAILAAVALSVGSLSVPIYVGAKAIYTGVLAAALTGPTMWVGLHLGATGATTA
jgi:hypothetical protein